MKRICARINRPFVFLAAKRSRHECLSIDSSLLSSPSFVPALGRFSERVTVVGYSACHAERNHETTSGGSLLRMDADLLIGSRPQTLVGRWFLIYLKVATRRFGPGMRSNHLPAVLIVAVHHQLYDIVAVARCRSGSEEI